MFTYLLTYSWKALVTIQELGNSQVSTEIAGTRQAKSNNNNNNKTNLVMTLKLGNSQVSTEIAGTRLAKSNNNKNTLSRHRSSETAR